MNEILKDMSEKEIQGVIAACNEELDKRKRGRRIDAANKALTALEELVKVAPGCYVDISDEFDAMAAPVFLDALVDQWKHQNFSFG
jgi:hypothetical protein